MKILMFSWKDIKNPAAGGAEVMTWEILKEMVCRGHKVTLFTSRYLLETPAHETVDGVEVYRAGGRFGVYFWAIVYYFKIFRGQYDVVIDQVNTVPFFTPLFVAEKKVAFFPQLARELWFYETRFPINLMGFLLEPFFLFFYRAVTAITISRSSLNDLKRFGIQRTVVVPVVGEIGPLKNLGEPPPGFNVGFVGRMVPGKRTLDAVEAFALLVKQIPEARLFLIGRGSESYRNKIRERVKDLGISGCVKILCNVTEEEKLRTVSKLHVLLVTSVKEGWGLVVTEAGSLGVPAVVYNVDGLRDSVQDQKTGLVCPRNTPAELAKLAVSLFHDGALYRRLRQNAWEDSKNYTPDKTLVKFIAAVENL